MDSLADKASCKPSFTLVYIFSISSIRPTVSHAGTSVLEYLLRNGTCVSRLLGDNDSRVCLVGSVNVDAIVYGIGTTGLGIYDGVPACIVGVLRLSSIFEATTFSPCKDSFSMPEAREKSLLGVFDHALV